MRYAFGEFELEDEEGAPPGSGRLTRRGHALPVRPKVLALITLLIRRRRRAVHRSELVARLWPDVRVGDSSLSTVLNEARATLGDTGAHQRWIRTLPGRGYRFEGCVELRCDVRDEETEPALLERRLDEVLVGRDDVLQIAEDALDGVGQAESRHLLVRGPLGAGRTRIAREVAMMASGRGWAVHLGRCERAAESPPLWVFSQILASLLEQNGGGRAAHSTSSATPEPRSIACDAPPTAMAPAAGLIALQLRFRHFEEIRRRLRESSEARPALIVLEDLHLADAATHLCLRHLLGSGICGRVLILGTLRSSPAPLDVDARRRIAELSSHPNLLRVPLAPLSITDTRELARHAGRVELEGQRLTALHERAGGNPLLLRELLRAERSWGDVADIAPSPSMELRTRLEECLLEALPAPAQALLREASALRGVIPLALLAALAGRSERGTLALLDSIERAGLLISRDGGAGAWSWSQPLVAEALYASLAPLERERLGRRVERALAGLDGDVPGAHGEAVNMRCEPPGAEAGKTKGTVAGTTQIGDTD